MPIVTDDQIQRLESALQQIKALDDSLQTNANALGKELMSAYQAPLTSTRTRPSTTTSPVSHPTLAPRSIGSSTAPVGKVPAKHPTTDFAPSYSPRSSRSIQTDGARLPKAERSILTVLAQYPEGRSNVQIAIMTGCAVGGGGFNNALGALRSLSHIHGG